MRNLLNPKWLLLLNTLPIAVLLLVFSSQYTLIQSLLEPKEVVLWKNFGLALVVLGALNGLYTVTAIGRKQNVSVWYGAAALVVYIGCLYAYGYYLSDLFPSSVPVWMIPPDMPLYAGTFLMPTLAYAVLVLVARLTPKAEEQAAGYNFLFAILMPIIWYVFLQLIMPLWKYPEPQFAQHALVILFIVCTVAFLFFLVRGVYVMVMKKGDDWEPFQLVAKVIIGLVFPILGLMFNNGLLLGNQFGRGDFNGIFGDFNNAWFYVLAVLNGVLLCLPPLENKDYRLALFIGRSALFAFTFYFFLVFLPFLPLSVIAIIAVGLGFLMLTPLVLFILHVNELVKDVRWLQTYFSTTSLAMLLVGSFLVLPACITAMYAQDKRVLTETLNYLYEPDYTKPYKLNTNSLARVLKVVENHKSNERDFILFVQQTPYLSAFYNWLVLDNLTLSDAKINYMESVFFGHPLVTIRTDRLVNAGVNISNLKVNSTFDNQQNAWRSWVDLDIANQSGSGFEEYATTINLPAGCWISDYYLYVGDKKEPGILAEKKSAMWVFSQIRNVNRDPGLLHYLTGNQVAFRVFPFAKDEVRRTGIEFIHKEPVELTIDSNSVTLGNNTVQNTASPAADKNVVYVSAAEKAKLPSVQRQPYYHFLVDVSANKAESKSEWIQRMDNLLSKNLIPAANAKFSFVNTYTSTVAVTDGWKRQLQEQPFEGGFFLERAIKTALFDSYQRKSNTYPVLVAVTDSMEKAMVENDFSDFAFAYPESNFFYVLDGSGNLQPHSLTAEPTTALPDTAATNFTSQVLAYPNAQNPIAYLPNDNEPSIVLKNEIFEVDEARHQRKKLGIGLGAARQMALASATPRNRRPRMAQLGQIQLSLQDYDPRHLLHRGGKRSPARNLAPKTTATLVRQQIVRLGRRQPTDERTAVVVVGGFVGGVFVVAEERVSILKRKTTQAESPFFSYF